MLRCYYHLSEPEIENESYIIHVFNFVMITNEAAKKVSELCKHDKVNEIVYIYGKGSSKLVKVLLMMTLYFSSPLQLHFGDFIMLSNHY